MSEPAQTPPGLDCPECGHRIPLSIPILLSGKPFFCPSCQLKIEVDTKKSAYVLERLKVYQEKMKKAEEIAKKVT